ncbi:hypothetical protein [Synechococcus phage Yong-M4-211]|nr:hypothetical protein [Synechococcus phage Yong-M4-211]
MTPSEDRVLNKLREEIARIIEPFYWRWLDVPGQEHAYAPGRQKTLAKADQIIAAWNRRADPLVEELRDDPRLHQAAYSLHQAGYHDLGEFIDGVREALALPVGGGSGTAR